MTTVPPLDPDSALFLDFDGTLAPLQDDPQTVRLPRDGAAVLEELNDRLHGALALISGRDLRDLSRRTPQGVWRIGGHGLERCAPGEAPTPAPAPAPAALAAALQEASANHPGAWIAAKGEALALHYRAAPRAEADLLRAATASIAAYPDYVVQAGKCVIEVKPRRADKGAALTRQMDEPAFRGRAPLMVGDDATDEDAMRAARRLGGDGVKVGPGETAAAFRMPDPAAVWTWLRHHARSL